MRCKYCGQEFVQQHGNQQYCSIECRDMMSGRCTHRAGTVKQCEYCGTEFIAVKGSEKFCSAECRRENRSKSEKEQRKELTKTCQCVCVECGKSFESKRDSKYCSDHCKNKYKYDQQITQKWGSKTAWRAEMKRRKEAALQKRETKSEPDRVWYEGKCVVCGTEFKTLNPKQKTCCKECGRKLNNARKQKRIPKEQIVDKDITLEALFRRDSGVCYLCGGMCNWSDKRSANIVGDTYPSIDHIIPVARGGKHAWNNVRLAHFKCNVAKSDSMIADAEKLIPDNAYQFKRIVPEHKKAVEQLDITGEIINKFESTAEAERQTGLKQRGIQKCARGELKTYFGYVWRYT